MKATGNVRRVDDLGRIVIPKEIRRTLVTSEDAKAYTYRISTKRKVHSRIAIGLR